MPQGDAPPHCQGEFANQIAGAGAEDRRAQYFAAPGAGVDLDQAIRFPLGDGPVDPVVRKPERFEGCARFPEGFFRGAHMGQFGVGVGGPGEVARRRF